MSIMLVSLANLKSFLEIDATNTAFDNLLNLLNQFVSDRIQQFLNRKLLKTQRIQYFQSGKKKYYLQAYPIDKVSPITVVYGNSIQTIDSDYVVWYDEGCIEFNFTTLFSSPKEISITYSGGYTGSLTFIGDKEVYIITSDLPDALQYACMLQVAHMFKRRKDFDLSSISLPDGSISTVVSGGDLLPEVKKILLAYRKFASEY